MTAKKKHPQRHKAVSRASGGPPAARHAGKGASRQPAEPRRGPGRPSSFNLEIAKAICERIIQRDKKGSLRSLKDVCSDADMPSEGTVFHWLSVNREFKEMYDRAREVRAEMFGEDVIAISDSEPDSNKARVRIDARKWYAAKLNPKRYGDKVEVGGEMGVNHKLSADVAVTAGKIAELVSKGSGDA